MQASTLVSIGNYSVEPDESITATILLEGVIHFGTATIGLQYNGSVVNVLECFG